MIQLAMFTEAEVPTRPTVLVIRMWVPPPGPPCERCGPDCCGTHETYDGGLFWWACNGSCDHEGRHD